MAKSIEPIVLTIAQIEDRLESAVLTLRRLPSADGPRGFRSSWPAFVQSQFTAYGYSASIMRVTPSALDIQEMEDALEWFMLISTHGDEARTIDDRRIVWLRSDRQPWRTVMRSVGLSRSQAHRRYLAALITMQKRLEKPRRSANQKAQGRVNAEGGTTVLKRGSPPNPTLNAEGGGRAEPGGETEGVR